MAAFGALLRAEEMAKVCSSGDSFSFALFVASIGEWGKNGDLFRRRRGVAELRENGIKDGEAEEPNGGDISVAVSGNRIGRGGVA